MLHAVKQSTDQPAKPTIDAERWRRTRPKIDEERRSAGRGPGAPEVGRGKALKR